MANKVMGLINTGIDLGTSMAGDAGLFGPVSCHHEAERAGDNPGLLHLMKTNDWATTVCEMVDKRHTKRIQKSAVEKC